ncbi:hypothetical protein LAZ67_2006567 [Cordylochernes scorpioides]|uniref:Uncharacterized protein n=1 Tax=Cordylochernes scorpioides TaxID=51811 RepID=A0ABY6K5K4_9ARAC|nr:hypothetical protein LAZ67_2006567 [Cordylochernes scorpioides]
MLYELFVDSTVTCVSRAEMKPNATVTKLFSTNIRAPDRLAVDWIYNHIYWADTDKNTIEVVDLATKMHKTIIDTMLDEPRGIALNPLDGWMIWSDWGDVAKIEKSGMDGSHRQTIITENLMWPNGITIDFVTKRIYWVDAKLHLLASADYDGGNNRIVHTSFTDFKHPYSVDIFERQPDNVVQDFVYWSDWGTESILKVNKFSGKELKRVVEGVSNLMEVRVFHQYKQPNGKLTCELTSK